MNTSNVQSIYMIKKYIKKILITVPIESENIQINKCGFQVVRDT